MRKHFLLLFLMALLPLAGFAASIVDISTADVEITLQTSSPVYNNAVQTPTITKVVVNGVEYTSEWTQFFTPKYYKRNTVGNWIPQNADQIQDAGEYAVAIVANGAIDAEPEITYTANKESDDDDWAFYTIRKKDLHVTLANGTKQYGGTDPTTLGVTPTDLPNGWTAPEFVFAALPRTAGEAVSSTGYAYTFTLDDNTQDDITSVNYKVIINNQPKLIVTKKQIALNYIGTAPVKTYGVGNTTATLGLNEEFLTAILNKANYEEPGASELVGGDDLADEDVLGGLTADKLVVSFGWAAPAGVESANADGAGNPLGGGAAHKVIFAIDESVATNYKFTVADVALTVKQAELSAAANAPFTFEKAETAPFTYNAADQTLTKTITYTANNEQLLAEGAVLAVTPQVTVSYKYKTLGTETPAATAVTSAGDFTAAGVYEAYVAPVADGNFYTESGDPIRVTALDYTINKKDLYVYVTENEITNVYQGSAYTLPVSTGITFQGLIASDATTLATDIANVKAIVDGTAATPVYTVKDAKTYTIVPYVAAANKLNDNYAVQTYTSTFTVSPLAITIDPVDMPNVVYGSAIAGTAAADATAVTGNVTVTKDNDLDPAIEAADQAKVLAAYNVVVADQTYAAGQTYTGAITLAQRDLDPTDATDAAIIAMLDNFDITEETGDVTIGKGTYSIVVKNKNKTYGDALAWTDFDYLTPGLTGTTKPASVKFILVNTADATDTYSQHNGDALPKNFGTYTIKVDAANSDLTILNYTDPSEAAGTLIAGELSIAKKALTFTTAPVKVNAGATKAALYTMGASKVTVNDLAYTSDKILFDLEYVENAVGTTEVTNKIALVGGTGDDAKDMRASTPADTYAAGYKVVEPTSVDPAVYANANYTITWNVTGELEVAGANVLLLSQSADDLMNTLTVADNTEYDVTLQNVKFNGDATTMKAKKWYSMVLPFKISVAQLSSTLGYAIVNRMDKTTSDGNLHFRLAFDEIPANEPFLVKSVKGEADHLEEAVDINTKTFLGVKIEKPDGVTVSIQTADASPIVFTGVYEKEHYLATGDKLYNGADSDLPVRVTKDNYSYLNPFRSYWTAPAAARIFVEDLNEDGTTAIKEINAQMEEIATDGWYTVNGIKLQGAPTEKGIYIHNGKKIVLK